MIGFCLVGWAMLSFAQPAEQLDVRILVDASAQVHARDEESLRESVTTALVRQLVPENKGGVWSYAGLTQRLAKHGSTDAMWQQVAAIHVQHLAPLGKDQNPLRALRNVLWDLDQVDRGRIHLVWVTDGAVSVGSEQATTEARRELLQALGNQMAAGRVTVHTAYLGASEQVTAPDDQPTAHEGQLLLMQLSEMTGGLHRTLTDTQSAQSYARDVLRLTQSRNEAVVDDRGRFQIAPGTVRFSAVWPLSQDPPTLHTPDGAQLSRYTPLPNGRWLKANEFEIATIEQPTSGWWQVSGSVADRVAVYGDLQVKVNGLRSPVVPSEETSALVEIYHWGERLENSEFLDLLDVKAWIKTGGDRQAMPIERTNSAFRVFFVNLEDGAHELEVTVVGPTFSHKIEFPFTVRNPLTVEFRTNADGQTTAWLAFSHADVNYATVSAIANVRRPPQLSVITPGVAMPSGLWHIAMPNQPGIVESSFALKGNYLNGDGFFMKTQALTLTLPMASASVVAYRFDAQGKQLVAPEEDPIFTHSPQGPAGASAQSISIESTLALPSETDALRESPDVQSSADAPLLPLWFVGVISLVSVLLGGVIWWLSRPQPLAISATEPTPVS